MKHGIIFVCRDLFTRVQYNKFRVVGMGADCREGEILTNVRYAPDLLLCRISWRNFLFDGSFKRENGKNGLKRKKKYK